MRFKKIYFFVLLIINVFLSVNIVKANAIWPTLAIEYRTSSLYIIIGGFIIEALFIKFCAKEKLIKSLYISAIMNLASAIIGGLLATFIGIPVWIIYYCFLNLLSFNPLNSDMLFGVISYIVIVCINVLIEGYVIDIIFWIDFKKSLWWLILSNFISVLIALLNPDLLEPSIFSILLL